MHSAFVGRVCPRCLMASVVPDTLVDSAFDLDRPVTTEQPLPTTDSLHIGARLGDYELLDVLGRGGMAVVYLARQISLDRLVAFKTIAAPLTGDARSQERFRREARAVAQLDHHGIVSVHDTGVLGDALFYTMDYVDGQDLNRLLRQRSLLPRESASLMRRIADAVGYAHSRGIVHRDLKPANILLDDAGEPHVADFGLAFEIASGSGITLTGDLLGTPPYMAPEVLAHGAGKATPQTDVYSLGAMFFQMLTGRTPFIGGSPTEILHLALNERPPSLRLLNPAVPRDLSTICLKCLERDPGKRYDSATDLAEDLRRFLAGETIIARPVSPVGHFARWCRRKPALAAVWFLVVALAIASTAATVRIRHEQARTEEALTQTRAAEIAGRERLRDARLAQARAIRRTTIPGRRDQALAALAEAAQIRPGSDLRDEALAALMLFDVKTLERWSPGLGGPARINLDPTGQVATIEKVADAVGVALEPATLWKWGADTPFVTLAVSGTRAIGSPRFSPDGKHLMQSFADGTLRVWRQGEAVPFLTFPLPVRPGSGRLARMINDHYAFTPDGQFIALGLPGHGLALRRLADGVETARWEEGDTFDTISVSPDGRYLAAESLDESRPRTVSLLSMDGLKPAGTFAPASPPGLLAWSGDSRVLTVGQDDGGFSLYDVRDGRLLSKITDAQRRSTAVRPLGGDALLAVTTTNSMHMLNAVLGREELSFAGVTRTPIAADPAGDTFVMACNDGTVTRMQTEVPLGFRTLPPSRAAGHEVMGNTFAIDFSPDGKLIASANRNWLVVYDAASGRLQCDLDTGVNVQGDMGSLAFSADGHFLYRCSSGSVFTSYPVTSRHGRGLELGTGQPLGTEKGFYIADVSADRQRIVLLNLASGTVRIVTVDHDGGKLKTLAQWVVPGVYNAALSPDGEQLITNSSGTGPEPASQRIRVYRTHDGTALRELDARISCDVAWSADGRTVITSNGTEKTLLWDTSDWHVKAQLTGELGGDVTTYAIAPDSSYAVITHDDRIHLVSTRDGALLGSFESPGATGLAAGVRFLPDRKRFAILWRDGRVDLVDPEVLRRGLAEIGLAW